MFSEVTSPYEAPTVHYRQRFCTRLLQAHTALSQPFHASRHWGRYAGSHRRRVCFVPARERPDEIVPRQHTHKTVHPPPPGNPAANRKDEPHDPVQAISRRQGFELGLHGIL